MANNIMRMMAQMLGGGGNPMQMLQQSMMKNPKNNQIYQQLQNSISSSGMTPRDYAMQYFKQQGVSEQQVMEIAKKFGIK